MLGLPRIPRVSLLVLSVAPLLSIYRAWNAAVEKLQGLMANDEAQRQILLHMTLACVAYALLIAFCLWHMSRHRGIGAGKKAAWVVGFLVMPMISVPAYLILHPTV